MIKIDGNTLSLKDLAAIIRDGEKAWLSEKALTQIKSAYQKIQEWLKAGETVYGVNTGVGALSEVKIPPQKIVELQRNLVLSHSTAVGEYFSPEVTRAIMLLRANSLSKGYSGVRPAVPERLLFLVNAGFTPLIPSRGSVGASGDLAPLSHLAQSLIGEGDGLYQGKVISSKKVHKLLGIEPLVLEAKEGLSLINGTQAMSGVLAQSLIKLDSLIHAADIIGGFSFFVLRGDPQVFSEALINARPHPGARETAENLRKLLKGGNYSSVRFQDPYSMRCIPQVHGAVKDGYRWTRQVYETEINSATDNPLIFVKENKVIRGGNFHGAPLALIADSLSISLCYLAGISERRTEKLLNHSYSGCPPFLARHTGLESGFMIVQYTAASLTSENKTLAHPASVDSIPTSLGQEDYANMGTWGAIKNLKILNNLEYILAIELMTAGEAMEYLPKEKRPEGIEKIYQAIRSVVAPLTKDRSLSPDIEKLKTFISGPEWLEVVKSVTGRKLL